MQAQRPLQETSSVDNMVVKGPPTLPMTCRSPTLSKDLGALWQYPCVFLQQPEVMGPGQDANCFQSAWEQLREHRQIKPICFVFPPLALGSKVSFGKCQKYKKHKPHVGGHPSLVCYHY